MARELVTQQGIGESADAVWRDMQAQQRKPPADETGCTSGVRHRCWVLAATARTLGSTAPTRSGANAPKFGVRPPPAPQPPPGRSHPGRTRTVFAVLKTTPPALRLTLEDEIRGLSSHSSQKSGNEAGSRECRAGQRERSRLTGDSRKPRKRNRSNIPVDGPYFMWRS